MPFSSVWAYLDSAESKPYSKISLADVFYSRDGDGAASPYNLGLDGGEVDLRSLEPNESFSAGTMRCLELSGLSGSGGGT